MNGESSSTEEHGPLLGRAIDWGNLIRAKFSEALSGVVSDPATSGRGNVSGIEPCEDDEFYALRNHSAFVENDTFTTIQEDEPLDTSYSAGAKDVKAPQLPKWVRRAASDDSIVSRAAEDTRAGHEGLTAQGQSDTLLGAPLRSSSAERSNRDIGAASALGGTGTAATAVRRGDHTEGQQLNLQQQQQQVPQQQQQQQQQQHQRQQQQQQQQRQAIRWDETAQAAAGGWAPRGDDDGRRREGTPRPPAAAAAAPPSLPLCPPSLFSLPPIPPSPLPRRFW